MASGEEYQFSNINQLQYFYQSLKNNQGDKLEKAFNQGQERQANKFQRDQQPFFNHTMQKNNEHLQENIYYQSEIRKQYHQQTNHQDYNQANYHSLTPSTLQITSQNIQQLKQNHYQVNNRNDLGLCDSKSNNNNTQQKFNHSYKNSNHFNETQNIQSFNSTVRQNQNILNQDTYNHQPSFSYSQKQPLQEKKITQSNQQPFQASIACTPIPMIQSQYSSTQKQNQYQPSQKLIFSPIQNNSQQQQSYQQNICQSYQSSSQKEQLKSLQKERMRRKQKSFQVLDSSHNHGQGQGQGEDDHASYCITNNNNNKDQNDFDYNQQSQSRQDQIQQQSNINKSIQKKRLNMSFKEKRENRLRQKSLSQLRENTTTIMGVDQSEIISRENKDENAYDKSTDSINYNAKVDQSLNKLQTFERQWKLFKEALNDCTNTQNLENKEMSSNRENKMLNQKNINNYARISQPGNLQNDQKSQVQIIKEIQKSDKENQQMLFSENKLTSQKSNKNLGIGIVSQFHRTRSQSPGFKNFLKRDLSENDNEVLKNVVNILNNTQNLRKQAQSNFIIQNQATEFEQKVLKQIQNMQASNLFSQKAQQNQQRPNSRNIKSPQECISPPVHKFESNLSSSIKQPNKANYFSASSQCFNQHFTKQNPSHPVSNSKLQQDNQQQFSSYQPQHQQIYSLEDLNSLSYSQEEDSQSIRPKQQVKQENENKNFQVRMSLQNISQLPQPFIQKPQAYYSINQKLDSKNISDVNEQKYKLDIIKKININQAASNFKDSKIQKVQRSVMNNNYKKMSNKNNSQTTFKAQIIPNTLRSQQNIKQNGNHQRPQLSHQFQGSISTNNLLLSFDNNSSRQLQNNETINNLKTQIDPNQFYQKKKSQDVTILKQKQESENQQKIQIQSIIDKFSGDSSSKREIQKRKINYQIINKMNKQDKAEKIQIQNWKTNQDSFEQENQKEQKDESVFEECYSDLSECIDKEYEIKQLGLNQNILENQNAKTPKSYVQ